jgi:hypothetical protein
MYTASSALCSHVAAQSQPIGALIVALVAVLCGDNDTAQRYAYISVNLGQPRHIAPATDIQGQLQLRGGKYSEAAESLARGLTMQQQAEGGANAARLMCHALFAVRLGLPEYWKERGGPEI